MNWTDEQKTAVDLRGKDLLVSAAAGSGKTAVLVERIIGLITDEKEPVGIDRLLVMTFTKAAAGEMRERISEALKERLRREPENRYLKMQYAMLPRAKIATIDSICSNLIKQNYQSLDLDPSFRVAEEGELRMIKNDIIRELLEEKYAGEDKAFSGLEESISGGGSDTRLYDMILKTYDFIRSYPFENVFFDKIYIETEKIMENKPEELPWMKYIMKDISETLDEYAELLSAAEVMCKDPTGPEKYLEAIDEAGEILLRLRLCVGEGYEKLREEALISAQSFSRLKIIRKDSCDEELKEAVKSIRNDFKDAVKEIAEEYLALPYDVLCMSQRGSARIISSLVELVREFSKRFAEVKNDKNIVDFSDLEHMALRLLWRYDDNGELRTTELADRLSEEFYEILIDEYQDSNYVQEYLLKALSAERFGRPDVFVVGDVKQSIYRFRLAKPEIFTGKYYESLDYRKASGNPEETKIKVELNRNFRSKREVLSSVNSLFSRIMRKSLGGVEYDEAAVLRPGAQYPEELNEENLRNGFSPLTELLLVTGDKEPEDESVGDIGMREAEERLVADKIRQLMSLNDRDKAFKVRDKKTGDLRPLEYRDIVILMRSPASCAKEMVNSLSLSGIPAYAETVTGYFSSIEVEVMLSMLEITDNPIQDIPLAAVMKSPIGGFSDEELALIRGSFMRSESSLSGDQSLYAALCYAAGEASSCKEADLKECFEKAEGFKRMLSYFRAYSMYHTVSELISEIYERTGYYACASAMPLGNIRRANLNMLLNRAEGYGATSFKGLFNFVRYIEELKKYDSDYGEASIYSEEDDIVRITSIHKSKGLEYPVVILTGLDRRFNRSDSREKVVFDSDLGIGMDYTDTNERIRYPSLQKRAIKRKQLIEGLGEELRVLYVAMTRAKEKLIMTAAIKDAEKKLLNSRPAVTSDGGEKLLRSELIKSGSFLDIILKGYYENASDIMIKVITSSELLSGEIFETAKRGDIFFKYENINREEVFDIKLRKELMKNLSFRYGYKEETELYPKRSVSEIKHEAMENVTEAEPESELNFGFGEQEDILYGRRKEANEGALRGTAYHRVFELLDFKVSPDEENTEAQLEAMRASGRLSEEEFKYIDCKVVLALCLSRTGEIMREAALRGMLFRERHFMVGRPAYELTAGSSSNEMQLLQGIIDAYIENEDSIVLIDYKTDKIRGKREEGAQELKRKYEVQLELYAKALEQLTGKPVTEMIIYSTELSESISL